MKLSTKGRYAVRAVLDLALHSKDSLVPLRNIAKRQGISVRYLEHIMNTLVSGGVVQGFRGKSGGFSLLKKPESITVYDVIVQVEGPVNPIACLENTESCTRSRSCVTYEVWKHMQKAIIDVLKSYSIQDLITLHYKKTEKADISMYYI